MQSRLKVSDSVLVFLKVNCGQGKVIIPYINGIVVECMGHEKTIYKVVGDNQIVYEAPYSEWTEWGVYICTYSDYLESLNKLLEESEDDKLKEDIKKTILDVRTMEMCDCNHLFVKMKSKHNSTDNPSTITCVCCGLTNRYLQMESAEAFHNFCNAEFKRQFGLSFDEEELSFISKEEFSSCHPRELYRAAREICPDGDNEALFNVMKALNVLETPQEYEFCDSSKEGVVYR